MWQAGQIICKAKPIAAWLKMAPYDEPEPLNKLSCCIRRDRAGFIPSLRLQEGVRAGTLAHGNKWHGHRREWQDAASSIRSFSKICLQLLDRGLADTCTLLPRGIRERRSDGRAAPWVLWLLAAGAAHTRPEEQEARWTKGCQMQRMIGPSPVAMECWVGRPLPSPRRPLMSGLRLGVRRRASSSRSWVGWWRRPVGVAACRLQRGSAAWAKRAIGQRWPCWSVGGE
jgi:hypothetical protein